MREELEGLEGRVVESRNVDSEWTRHRKFWIQFTVVCEIIEFFWLRTDNDRGLTFFNSLSLVQNK